MTNKAKQISFVLLLVAIAFLASGCGHNAVTGGTAFDVYADYDSKATKFKHFCKHRERKGIAKNLAEAAVDVAFAPASIAFAILNSDKIKGVTEYYNDKCDK